MYKLKYWASTCPEVIIKIPHTFPNANLVLKYGEFIKNLAWSMCLDRKNSDLYLDLVATKEEKEVVKDLADRYVAGTSRHADIFFDTDSIKNVAKRVEPDTPSAFFEFASNKCSDYERALKRIRDKLQNKNEDA